MDEILQGRWDQSEEVSLCWIFQYHSVNTQKIKNWTSLGFPLDKTDAW